MLGSQNVIQKSRLSSAEVASDNGNGNFHSDFLVIRIIAGFNQVWRAVLVVEIHNEGPNCGGARSGSTSGKADDGAQDAKDLNKVTY